MSETTVQDVFFELRGQDDNLGDSALRMAYLHALEGSGRRIHLHLGTQVGPATSDYVSGLRLKRHVHLYPDRAVWVRTCEQARRAVLATDAGEIRPRPGDYPGRRTTAQLRRVIDRGGVVIMAGMGLWDLAAAKDVMFHPVLRECAVFSWRDRLSRQAAGFGDVAPDWAYSLGTSTSEWASQDSRRLLAVTLRFDRPMPDANWFEAVRTLAAQTETRIVTVAQVARDAPRAVRLAEALGGEYRAHPSTSHADLDSHVRAIYAQSLAVVSDRAHGLIIGATEGAYPLGSAAKPEKIHRLLDATGLGELTGYYHQLSEFAPMLESRQSGLAPAVDDARASLAALRLRIRIAMEALL